ncbi:hypothetical protein PR202_gb20337 [Eleusine coracana subsp. coracana]|uniref:glutathione transferase n=1 Tax=Eleusine coracana subsp. coracana TaxID=191504 RepID=A0AAV5FB63_ELECO|nr:hypothetical protein PR202_gb20337 [Eleusine coracana subsp. coracana]
MRAWRSSRRCSTSTRLACQRPKYLAGDFISFADLTHFPYTYYFMKTPHASVLDSYPHVKAWWESLVARPAAKKLSTYMVW